MKSEVSYKYLKSKQKKAGHVVRDLYRALRLFLTFDTGGVAKETRVRVVWATRCQTLTRR